jgi:hypothetical protein
MDIVAHEVSNYFRLPYKPTPKQLLFHTTVAQYRLFGGMVGGGKSTALRWECFAQCLAIPRWTALLLRRTSKELEDNHISKMRLEMPQELATYNEQDGVLTFFNGSTMRFGHIQTKRDLHIYQGGEYGVIAPDELTNTLAFDEFTFLTSRNRNVNGRPNFAAASNPGGIGHAYCKALFHDKRQFMGWPSEGYVPEDFAYIPASIYDNPALIEKNPEYLKYLKNLPPAQRAAYLDGSWDLVAGQYFDCWNFTQHVDMADRVESPPWCERNIGIDWGFSHNSAVEWGVTDERAETLTVYRELVAPRMTPEQLGEAIVALTPQSERGRIANIYLSHDAHELRKEEFSIADQLGAVLAKNGLPWPQNARSSRVAGWVHMYEMLRAGQLKIHKSCQHLIGAIPELQRDPDCSDDVLKVDGDDAPDALRYLIQNRWGTGNPPFEVQVGRNFAALEETHGKAKDMNQVYIRQLMAKAQARKSPDRPFSLDRGGPKARGRRAGAWRFGR